MSGEAHRPGPADMARNHAVVGARSCVRMLSYGTWGYWTTICPLEVENGEGLS